MNHLRTLLSIAIGIGLALALTVGITKAWEYNRDQGLPDNPQISQEISEYQVTQLCQQAVSELLVSPDEASYKTVSVTGQWLVRGWVTGPGYDGRQAQSRYACSVEKKDGYLLATVIDFN